MGLRSSLATAVITTMSAISMALLMGCGGRIALDDESIDPGGPGDDGVVPILDASSQPAPTVDAGPDATRDTGAIVIPGLPTLPGLDIDAGPLGACLSCTQDKCGTQVDACVSSPACLQEGFCDILTCFGGSGTGTGTGTGTGGASSGGLLGGLDLACFDTCGSDATASKDLTTALLCVFGSCSTDCLGAIGSLGSLGSGSGLGGLSGLTGTSAPPIK